MPWTVNPDTGYLDRFSTGMSPAVPTTFQTDSGSAVPVANTLNILGIDSSVNNDNGIETQASGSTVNVVLTNRVTGGISTIDATPTTALTFNLGATPGVFYIDGSIVAYDTTDVAGGVYHFISGMRTSGAAATELGTEFKDSFEEAAMASSDFNVIASGNDVIIQVIGIAAKNINWNVYLNYRFVG